MIAIGSDHGGFKLKTEIKKHLEKNNVPFIDCGTNSEEACDYPIFAKKVTDLILNDVCDKGILICGTGIGISIAANRNRGIRAALCGDTTTAGLACRHNNANVLALGGRIIGDVLAVEIVDTFLNTKFTNEERHIDRISQLDR